jgi:hypothetical protein
MIKMTKQLSQTKTLIYSRVGESMGIKGHKIWLFMIVESARNLRSEQYTLSAKALPADDKLSAIPMSHSHII